MNTNPIPRLGLILILALAAGLYPTPFQTMGAVALANAPTKNQPAQMELLTGADLAGQDAGWWVAVQEDIRLSEYHVTWELSPTT
jgi:hypothetical protein